MLNWDELKQVCQICQACPLCKNRTNMVFGTGNPQAEIMCIGEGPGQQEDLTGLPFVGPAGILLDKMLSVIGLSREKNVYIANIVKCRPPHNRDPLPEEQEACIGYLRNQVALIKPKIIVCLGRIAAMRIISSDFKITKDHGIFYQRGAFILTALYHPSALLRDPSKKQDTFMDLKKLEHEIKTLCKHTY
jgi:DNA polymerase